MTAAGNPDRYRTIAEEVRTARIRHRTRWHVRRARAAGSTGLAGGVADLGSLAAYPMYCLPNYGFVLCPLAISILKRARPKAGFEQLYCRGGRA